MKRLGHKIIAGSVSLMLATGLFVPTTAKAADKAMLTTAKNNVLVITQDMVDSDGECVLSGEDFDKVVLPSDVEITCFYVDNCDIGEFMVESGNNPEVQVWDASIDRVVVSPAEIVDENEAIQNYVKEMIASSRTDEMDVDAYLKNIQDENKKMNSLAPKLVLKGAEMESSKQALGSVTLGGNATIDFTDAKADAKLNIVFSSSQMTMDVTVKGYDGDIDVKQTTAEGAAFGRLNIKLMDSDVADMNIDAQGNANIALRSSDTKTENVILVSENNTTLTLATDVNNVTVAEGASNATIKVLSDVENADIKGSGITIDIGTSASVESATVAGSGNAISGRGDLGDCTIAEDTSAAVSVSGATVTGTNSYVPSVFAPSTPNTPEVDDDTDTEPETPGESEDATPGVITDVTLIGGTDATVTGNTVVYSGNYKTATYNVPTDLVDRVTAVTLNITASDGELTKNQFCVKMYDKEGAKLQEDAYPSFTDDESANYSYAIAGVAKVEIMSLEASATTPLTLTVNQVTLTLTNATEDDSNALQTIVTITEGDTTITLSDTCSFTATASSGETIEWSSSDGSIATVDANGKVTPISDGTVTIIASVGEVVDEVTVTVENAFLFQYYDSASSNMKLVKDIPYTDVEFAEKYSTVCAPISQSFSLNSYDGGNNFVNALPSSLKNDEVYAEKFTTIEGIIEVVDKFQVYASVTEGYADGMALQAIVQNADYSLGTYSCCADFDKDGNASVDVLSALFADWTGLSQIYAQVINADEGVTISGTYSIKVVLK